ncbi:hypothetical protein JQ599_09740 [Bradyrhizobium diazoefficiens]|nr:hypothetical protein [Bradyrhizobium diazoefficiens]MBR0700181.1 hypothetical protein [Bradyrhizobium diazoefficiens]MBR0768516.1 hypothetical protein [Bradyrhizobium diazoefficiens]
MSNGNDDDWTLGNLTLDEKVIVQNILSSRRIYESITEADFIDEDNRTIVGSYNELIRGTIADCKRRFGITAEIKYCFLSSMRANAIAARDPSYPNMYFIVVFLGATIANGIFKALLNKRRTRRLLNLSKITDAGLAEISSTLTTMGLRWLIYHELGHIKNGHLHLNSERAYGAVAIEQMQQEGKQDKNLTMHALEMDADCFALVQTMVDFFQSDRALHLLETRQNILRALLIAVCSTMRALDLPTWSTSQLLNCNHQPAVIRAVQMGATAYSLCEKNPSYGILPAETISIGMACIDCVERELRKVKQDYTFPPDAVEFLGSERYKEYMNALNDRWATIRSELQPYLLGGQLAPPTPPLP